MGRGHWTLDRLPARLPGGGSFTWSFVLLRRMMRLDLESRALYRLHMLEPTEIQAMSMAERLRALERLWDGVCREDADVPSPAWHEEVLAERKARAARGDSRFLTLDQVKARFRVSGT